MTASATAPRALPSAKTGRLRAASERSRTWWALGGCVLLALILRAPYLTTPLGRDEGGLSYMAQHWASGHGQLYGGYWVDRPPLMLLLFRVAVLGGPGGVRALGAVAAVALVIGVALIARVVAGSRAGWIAGLLAALLISSVSIGSIFTPGEILAVVPSVFSVLCLMLAHRSRQARYIVIAGALAVAAVLVKQSFLDAGFAGVVFIAVSATLDREARLRWPLAYVAGGAIPLAALLVWLVAARESLSDFAYTMFGFRIQLLHTLASSSIPLHVRLEQLKEPAWESGLIIALAVTPVGLWFLRKDRVLLVTFIAWLAAAIVGVLGGGSYFAHYLIGLIPVSCVATGIVLARAALPIRIVVLAAVLALALNSAREGVVYAADHQMRHAELDVARYLREHARPGDTDYLMYARPNVVYYAGLRHPYPYMWSLIIRARPGAREALRRSLASPRRPTWLVEWQDVGDWGLDNDGRTAALIKRGYRLAAIVCDHPIYLRNDRPAPPLRIGCPGES